MLNEREELLAEIIAILRLRRVNHVVHISTAEKEGYAAVLVPDSQVRQWINVYDETSNH